MHTSGEHAQKHYTGSHSKLRFTLGTLRGCEVLILKKVCIYGCNAQIGDIIVQNKPIRLSYVSMSF